MHFPWTKPPPSPPVSVPMGVPAALMGGLPWYAAFLALHAVAWFAWKTVGGPFTATKSDTHVAAHFICSMPAFAMLAAVGVYGWFFECTQPGLDHIGGYLWSGETAAFLMTGFQMYEVTCCVLAPKLSGKTGEHLAHHISVLILTPLAAGNEYLYYYSPFFMGVTELSSLPLSLMDFFKAFPHMAKRYPTLSESVRTVFAVLFLLLRVLYWPVVSSQFWMDTIDELNSGRRLGKPLYVMIAYWVGNVLLTALQLFWGSLIVKGIIKKVKGEKEM